MVRKAATNPKPKTRAKTQTKAKKPLATPKKSTAQKQKASTRTRNTPVRKKKTSRPAARLNWRQVSLSPVMLRGAMLLAGLMVVAGALLWLKAWISQPEHLTIAEVQWEGDFRYYDRVDLEQQAEPYLATNLYLLESTRLEEVLEAHNWVRDVSLRRVWPDQLIISVESQTPIAFWGSDRLLNRYGGIFSGSLPDKQGVIPLIYSPDDNGREMGERYVQLMQALQDLDLEIVALTEDERGSWQMRLRQGPLVVIGNKDQAKRIERFKVGYRQELQDSFKQIERIDLRYTNGFAVKWKQGSKGAVGAVSSLDSRLLGSLGS